MTKFQIPNPKGICLLFVICVLCIGISPLLAQYSGNSEDQNQAEKNYDLSKPDTDTSQQADKQETPADIEIDNLKAKGVIKAEKGLCIKGNCKDNWPTLKCADFDSRPAGESGDSFCQNTGKTCLAVSVGSGASFFSECSTSPAAMHKTRCCWVE